MKHRLAKCCSPTDGDPIIAFLKQGDVVFSVHRADCVNLSKVPPERLVAVTWAEINAAAAPAAPVLPDSVYTQLDDHAFAVLRHHQVMGVDYAAVVARQTGISREEVFTLHKKLRALGLLARVEPKMIRYRKGIVDGKWIKHRNHTYYDLTEQGRAALARWEYQGPQ